MNCRVMRIRNRAYRSASAFFCLGIIAAPVYGQEFTVTGITTYKVLYSGDVRVWRTNSFTVSVSNCNWLIRSTPIHREELDYTEMGYANGEIRMLYHFTKSVNGAETNILVGKVDQNDVPPDDGSTISHLWLAYASGCYFAQITNTHLKPVWLLDDFDLRYEGFTVNAGWKVSDLTPKLPEFVVYFNDGVLRARDSTGRVSFKARPPYDGGYTNAIFESLIWTNIGRIALPLAFSFQRFGLKNPAASSNDLALINLIEAQADQVSTAVGRISFGPSFAGTASVADQRFNPPLRDLIYTIRDGRWPAKTDSKLLKEYNHQAQSRGIGKFAGNPPSGIRRLVIQCLFVILILIPLAGLMIRKLNPKNQRKTKTGN